MTTAWFAAAVDCAGSPLREEAAGSPEPIGFHLLEHAPPARNSFLPIFS